MKITLKFLLAAVFAATLAACGGPAGNSSAGNAGPSSTPYSGPPAKDALMALEKSAYEAWKNKDAKFWGTFLASDFVGFGTAGRLDKTAAIKEYGGTDCDVKSYSLSDDQMTPLGDDVAIVTYKTTIDATCSGHKLPAHAWGAAIYVRGGSRWSNVFHAETPVSDPKAPPAAAPEKKDPAAATPTAADTPVDPFIASEQKAWEAWKNKDAAALVAYAGKDLISISPDGNRLDRAASLKSWTEDNKCEINSISLTDGARKSLGKDLLLVTYKASIDGTCGGQPVPAAWCATVYTNDGTWKATFLQEVPAN
ncbi:MAG TPA: nuclear transport factor 2 family protein [Pyrinomonadaceae bacterium]|nr:nuclear transport factor 2 family protein [Pyrinomonadaceae bacterium]